MNNTAFVNAIKLAVEESSTEGMKELLQSNKIPRENIRRMSAFYNSLNEGDQKVVQEIIKESVSSAIFGFFCVLDGVRSIENGPDKGSLELKYKNATRNEEVLLNDFEEEFLHDLYND